MRDELLFREVGRLQGRLHYSPMRLPWMIRMRVRGIVHAAENAGIPVQEEDLGSWIAGRSLPPRYREGINDPIRISTVAHLYLMGLNDTPGSAQDQAAITLNAIFDHRKAVLEWSFDEMETFLPYWQSVVAIVRQRQLPATIDGVASGVLAMLQHLDRLEREALQLESTPTKPEWIRAMPLSWLASIRVPQLLYRSGAIGCVLPHIVPSVRFLDTSADEIGHAVKKRLKQEVMIGHQQLDQLERAKMALVDQARGTRRSRIDAAADLMWALPSIRRDKLANTLGITPQGAGYLIKKMENLQQPAMPLGRSD